MISSVGSPVQQHLDHALALVPWGQYLQPPDQFNYNHQTLPWQFDLQTQHQYGSTKIHQQLPIYQSTHPTPSWNSAQQPQVPLIADPLQYIHQAQVVLQQTYSPQVADLDTFLELVSHWLKNIPIPPEENTSQKMLPYLMRILTISAEADFSGHRGPFIFAIRDVLGFYIEEHKPDFQFQLHTTAMQNLQMIIDVYKKSTVLVKSIHLEATDWFLQPDTKLNEVIYTKIICILNRTALQIRYIPVQRVPDIVNTLFHPGYNYPCEILSVIREQAKALWDLKEAEISSYQLQEKALSVISAYRNGLFNLYVHQTRGD